MKFSVRVCDGFVGVSCLVIMVGFEMISVFFIFLLLMCIRLCVVVVWVW